jgi:hypothetical protein
MLCHGSMLTVGIFLFYTNHVETSFKTVLRAAPIFITNVSIAVALNELAFRKNLLVEHDFNMFFINPHCDPYLPVYSWFQENTSFAVCIAVYVAAFTLAAFLVMLSTKGIKHLFRAR